LILERRKERPTSAPAPAVVPPVVVEPTPAVPEPSKA
jgi:hypothetical protein